MITVIAQSARIARTISYALGADFEYNGYYANEKYFITWTYGHMVELSAPGMGRDFWLSNQSFPILPESFPLTHAPSQHAPGRYMPDPQLAVIKHLLEKSKKVVLATDPTDRGDLMAGYLIRFLGFEGKVIRIALNDLMHETIKNAITYPSDNSFRFADNLNELEVYDRMDWLINLNINRAIAFSVGRNTYPVSRTSLPILHLVAEREKEIREFSPQKTIIPTITVRDAEGEVFSFRGTKEWDAIPEEFKEAVKAGASVEVVNIETEEVDTKSPKLLNIEELQKIAALHFGMDPLETYRIARSLYEKKRISFPGSSREGLIRRDFDDFKKDIYPAMRNAECFKNLMGDNYTPYYTPSAKSLYNRPHGIALTAFPLVGLSDDERKIIYLVGRGMLATFQRSFRRMVTKVTLACGGYQFVAKYRKVVRTGWVRLFDDTIKSSRAVPNVKVGQTLTVESVGEIGRTTKQPKPMDDYTLLKTSFSLHASGCEEGVVKDIRFLRTKGYLHRNLAGEYSLTEKGKALAYVTRGMRITFPEDLEFWEEAVYQTVSDQLSKQVFDGLLHRYVTKVTNELLASHKLSKPLGVEEVCPKCGHGKMRIFGKIAKCSDPECGHYIHRQIQGVTLSSREIHNLLSSGSTSTIRGFIGADGKPFAGKVTLDDNHSPVVIRVSK